MTEQKDLKRRVRERMRRFSPQMSGWLAIDCYGIDGVRSDTGLVQTGPDRFGRQPGPVFHAAKPFFLGSGNAKVTKQGRLLNLLNAGECFGEMAYIKAGGMTRQATP